MIIAVDFDGTCVKHRYPMVGEDVDGAVSVLKELVRKGHKIILYAMRGGDTLDDAISWFMDNDIELWGINRNPEQYRWSSSPKVFANLYIDDAALGIPLIEPEDDRDYVDWNRVRDILSLGKLSPQDDIRYSIEYKDSIVPLQESIGEDATTVAYKKTYKFIGTW
jgi:hypothetical protein